MALGAVGALAVLVGAVALAARPGVTLAVVAAALVVRETLRRGLPAVTAARRQPGVEAAPEP